MFFNISSLSKCKRSSNPSTTVPEQLNHQHGSSNQIWFSSFVKLLSSLTGLPVNKLCWRWDHLRKSSALQDLSLLRAAVGLILMCILNIWSCEKANVLRGGMSNKSALWWRCAELQLAQHRCNRRISAASPWCKAAATQRESDHQQSRAVTQTWCYLSHSPPASKQAWKGGWESADPRENSPQGQLTHLLCHLGSSKVPKMRQLWWIWTSKQKNWYDLLALVCKFSLNLASEKLDHILKLLGARNSRV